MEEAIIEKQNEATEGNRDYAETVSLKDDEGYISRGFGLCELFQRKRELLQSLKQQQTPERIGEIAVLNGVIREKEDQFWKEAAVSMGAGNKFAFEELSRRYELDLPEKRMLLFFFYLEFFHVSKNVCPEMELLEVLNLEGTVLSRIRNFKYCTKANRLIANRLIVVEQISAPESATQTYALSSSAVEAFSLLLNGQKIDLEARAENVSQDKAARECDEVGIFKEPEYKLEDVVLQENLRDKVMFFLTALREPAIEAFGIGQTIKKNKGVNFLFYGPPGTGKSMLAEGVASYLGKKILYVETPKIFSRWVGVTDKAIAKIFRVAKENNLVICMDEADSLLYNRMYAGQEHDIRFVNDMLQEIERFDGVAIFTTNLDSHLDPALERRISLRVKLELPDEKMRAAIWQAHIPPLVKVGEDVNFSSLAKQFEFSGGYIKNAVLNALRKVALRKQDMVTMEDLVWSGSMEKEGLYNKEQPKGSIGFTALG